MTTSGAPDGRPRLSPFAFPSDTVFRFGLLVAAVLGANLYVWEWISTAFRDPAADAAAAAACLSLRTEAADLGGFTAATDAFSSCVAQLYRYQVGWMLGGTAALLLVAAVLLLAAPRWISRRRRLQQLTEEEAPAAVAVVRELAREQGVPEPELLWNPLDLSPGGLAFGRPGRYAIALTGGLVVKGATDPPAFRAIVRHELAHLRNRDVGITYFALAIWYAFLLTSVVPFFVTLADEGASTVWSLLWRLAALAALVYLTRNAVLRSREIYADVRASANEEADGALRRVLAGLPPAAAGVVGRLRRLHPDPEQRLAAVEDTRPLFPLGAVVAFAAGLTATIAYDGVVSLLATYLTDPFDLRFLAALAFAPLAVGVVGVAVWRAAFASLAEGREPASPWRNGLALALGFLVGPELALARPVAGETSLLRDAATGAGTVWALALVAGLVLLIAWIRTSATWWLQALGGRRPQLVQAVGLLVAAGALTAFMGFFYVTRQLQESLAVSRAATEAQHAAVDAQVWAVPRHVWQLVMDGELLVIVNQPIFVPVLVLLWLFPLAATLVRRRPEDAPWAFLDPGGRLKLPPLELRPLSPLAIGAAAGAAFLVAAALIRLAVHEAVAAETRATDAAILSFYVALVALALLAQAGAGAAGSLRGGLVGSLAAAFVAGCFGWLGIVGGPAAGGCVDALSLNPGPCAWTVPASFSWDVFKQVIGQGAVAGLAGGLPALGVHALLRRGHTRDALRPAGVAG